MIRDFFDTIETGDEVCFFEGKNNRNVAYLPCGKVILCKHKIPIGYAKIKTVEDRNTYFLVTAEHIISDLYSGVTYDEFMQVLPKFGFKVGFDMTFQNPHFESEEHEIFAYNLEYNTCIVAETFGSEKTFNKIEVYCPNVGLRNTVRNQLFARGNSCFSVFNLCHGNNRAELLTYIMQIMERAKAKHGVEWPENETLSLWNYSDTNLDTGENENGNYSLWENTITRLKMADPECLQIFKNSKRFVDAMARVGVQVA